MSKYTSTVSPFEEIYEHVGNLNDLIIHSLSGITSPDPNYSVTRPNADCFSIEYVMDGEGFVQENGQSFSVKKGDFFILHPWANHHYYSSRTNPWKKIWLYIANAGYHVSTILSIYDLERKVVFPSINSSLNLEAIFDLHKLGPIDFSSKLELNLYELIMKLYYTDKKSQKKDTPIHLAKWYINQNINTKITVEDVCNYVNLSPPYFSQMFKNEYGITPSQYILKKKMTLAKHLLATSTYSIADIADVLYFTDAAHFSRTFQKYCHVAPTTYRKHVEEQTKRINPLT